LGFEASRAYTAGRLEEEAGAKRCYLSAPAPGDARTIPRPAHGASAEAKDGSWRETARTERFPQAGLALPLAGLAALYLAMEVRSRTAR
jgi:hypothetical protein